MIARKTFLITSSQFFIRFLGWLGLVILARFWTVYADTALGIIGFAMSFLALFNVLADLGFSRAHVKRISEGIDIGRCIGTFATIKILLTGFMVLIFFIAFFILKNFLHYDFSDTTTEIVIMLFVLYYVFFNLTQIATATFEGTREIAKKQITHLFEGVKTPLMIVVAIAGVSVAGVTTKVLWPDFLRSVQQYIADHGIYFLAMTYISAMFASFLAGMWFLRKYPIKKPSWNLFKSYVAFALPIMLFSVIGVLSVNIDKLMIGYFWKDQIYQVGYYFTMQQIEQMLAIFYLAVGVVLFPTISRYHSYRDFKQIKKATHMAERYISMIMVPPVVIIIVFVYPVIKILLSNEFLPAASVLIVLTIYTYIISLNRPYSSLINGMNRPAILTKISLIIVFVNIPLNYLFIPRNGLLSPIGINGATGAGIATVISAIIGYIGMRLAAKKLTDIKLEQTHMLLHIFAGFIMGVVLYFLAFRVLSLEIVPWYLLIMFIGIGVVVYVLVLTLLKEFNRKDFNFFLGLLNPKEMFNYVSSELKHKPKKPSK